MSERERMLKQLGEAGILGGIRWAFDAAARRTRADYDEEAGHDATLVGVMRWVLLRDRLDRVFSCGKYATTEDATEDAGLDVVYASLTENEIATFPAIKPGTVVRSDLQGSPGWSTGEIRWLLASAEFGGMNEIKWAQRSPLKQRVARQPDPDSEQMSIEEMLHEIGDPWAVQLSAALAEVDAIGMPTLVVAHAHDIDTDDRQLYLGLPSLEYPDQPWAWKKNLLSEPPNGSGGIKPTTVSPHGPADAPDAPVRLRQPSEKTRNTGDTSRTRNAGNAGGVFSTSDAMQGR